MPELDRRDFLKIVGLGAGAAAAAGCSDPIEKLVPYVIQPESVTPGIATTYASTCQECSLACGIHVKTREGRPIKVEGNPLHPINQGALCGRGQMGVARAYHPDRYDGPKKSGASGLEATTWEEALAAVQGKIKASAGSTWVLGAPVGPSLSGVIDAFVSGVGAAGRVVYEPFAFDALEAATEKVFGVATRPIFDLTDADFILDFGFDVIDSGTSPVENSRQLADARDVDKHGAAGARLVTISPRMDLTSSSADKWWHVNPGTEGLVALALAEAVAKKKGASGALMAAIKGARQTGAALQSGLLQTMIQDLTDQLVNASHAVALPPGVAGTSSVATSTNAAVLLLNAALGAVGTQMKLPVAGGADSSNIANFAELQKLIAAMNSGAVKVLLVHGNNPAYSLPGFADALAKVDTVVSFASMQDETSEASTYVLPDHSSMESWGDAEPRPGVRSLVQPTVRPLVDSRALGDSLLELGRSAGASMPDGSFHDVVKANWSGTDWVQALSNGGVFGDVQTADVAVQDSITGIDPSNPQFDGSGEFTLIAFPHSYQTDGSGAALPWAQEVPDPVTKLSWNSWVEMSFDNAARLDVTFGDVVKVTTPNGSFEASVFPRGGIRHDVIAVPIGQGHTVGYYASMGMEGEPGKVRGANVLAALSPATDESGSRVFFGTNATVEKTGAFRRLALSQWTDNQRGRELAPEMSLLALAEGTHNVAHFDAHASETDAQGNAAAGDHGDVAADAGDDHADAGHHLLPFDPAFDALPGQPYRWGMVIDNDRCNGCSACITACYTENNISIVGELQAIKHREMTWLRIERYVGVGDTDGGEERRPFPNREQLGESEVRHLPMPCQHCGAAPCEAVCPVIGTYHTDEGINGMVYNRCVGTRYCANNCTYKVRRFNYWDYGNKNWPGMLGMMLNPDVTVRQQGVMEKCSFCVQRIAAARQPAKDEGRDIADGEVLAACQQTCPTNAITFGNWREEGAKINELVKDNARNYNVLHVLNTRPAVTYLAQVSREEQEGQH